MKRIFTSILFFALALTSGFSQTAPDFSFTDINGEEHSLQASLDEGKVIILDFFFVDCPPCQQWAPQVDELVAEFENTNVELWALSDRDANSYISSSSIFNPTHSNHFSGGSEGGGNEVINTFAGSFNFVGFPTYSVICNDGSITWDVWPLTAGVPELSNLLTPDCGVSELSNLTEIDALNGANIFPNPATSSATMNFVLETSTELTISLTNMLGQVVKTIPTADYAAGNNTVQFDLADVAQGMYVVSLQSQDGLNTLELSVTK